MRPDNAEKHIEEILRLIGEIEGFLQGVSFDEFEHKKISQLLSFVRLTANW